MSTLTRNRPAPLLGDLRHGVDRLFADFLPAWFEEDGKAQNGIWAPHFDFTATEAEFIIRVDLPGIDREDVKVEFGDGRLSISGERRHEAKEETESYVRMERSVGTFFRSIQLPSSIQPDRIAAEMENGVLTLRIPKSEEIRPRRIKIGQ
jgi:HSP20 family protein